MTIDIHPSVLQQIRNMSDQSDNTSWKRKQTNIERLVEEANEINEEMTELHATLLSKFDEIESYRTQMLDTCIHPEDSLVLAVEQPDDKTKQIVTCKFCNKSLLLKVNSQ